jgi:Family of unknown function (DUF6312)
MDMSRLTKSVRQITVLQRDGSGALSPVVVFKRRRSKKKSTRLLRPLEKSTRSIAEATDAFTGSYLKRHKRSNRKHRDGWLRDVPGNNVKATRKALKKIRPASFLGL